VQDKVPTEIVIGYVPGIEDEVAVVESVGSPVQVEAADGMLHVQISGGTGWPSSIVSCVAVSERVWADTSKLHNNAKMDANCLIICSPPKHF
jgi:hypothetical protein